MTHLPPEKLEELATSKAADPHLAECAECRKAVGSARARRMLLKGLKDVTLTEAAFRRVEAKLASDARAPVSPWGLVLAQLRSSWMLGAAILAVVLLVVVPRLQERGSTVPPVAVKETPVQPQVAPRPANASEWTAVVVEGTVHRNGSALAAGDVVKPADLLDARMGRVVLAGLGHEVRLELHGLAKFGGAAAVSLEEGTLAVDAVPEVLVEAAGAWVLGSDAAFVVSRAAAEVVVEALKGTVRVGSESALRDSVALEAPRRLKLPLPVQRPFTQLDSEPAPYPFPKVPKQPWARLDVSDLPDGTTFDVDGHHGGTPTSMMLAAGRHRVLVQVPGQGSRETWVQLVSGSDTHLKLPPRSIGQQKDEPPPSEDAIADLQRALKDQRPKLRACYEKWLKANPVASGEVMLTLVVSKSGKVVAARVDEATIPRESVDCLVRTGKRLVLPALGSEQEIEVPLSFTQSGGRP